MASSSNNRTNTEYVLGTLDDDSDDDLESDADSVTKKVIEYEEKTLKEIGDWMDEVEKTSEKIDETTDEILYDRYAEHLLQIIIKLDNVDPKGNKKIREARKDAIVYAQGTLQKLDRKMKPGEG